MGIHQIILHLLWIKTKITRKFTKNINRMIHNKMNNDIDKNQDYYYYYIVLLLLIKNKSTLKNKIKSVSIYFILRRCAFS
jgi:hypothetical protein